LPNFKNNKPNDMTVTNYKEYFQQYISQVDSQEPITALQETQQELLAQLEKVNEEKGMYSYEDGKWTIKEVISHIIDAERVFAYRALSFARGDTNNLAGFDDHLYADNSGANERPMEELLAEFDLVRKASVALCTSFTDEMWTRTGTANNITIDVKSLVYLIAGHCRHHGNILRERYLV